LSASDLGAVTTAEAVRRAGLAGESVHEVLMGNVLQAGQGQNPARQAALKAKLGSNVPCTTVNMVCGSGLKSVIMAAQSIKSGDAGCIVAGGMESMSQAPYVLSRSQKPFGDLTLCDVILRDGLLDAMDGRHMGAMAELLGERFGITREQQDEYAHTSQQRCATALESGCFADETVSVSVTEKKETRSVDRDEHPRPETTLESLAKLRPAFAESGTITAGNSSGINDGAAAVVMVSADQVGSLEAPPLGRIVSWACSAREPEMFGVAPAQAVRTALERAGLALDQIGLIEANEAFAVQTLALGREMGWDAARVNVNGGAIALGHPIGASGARILVSLLHEMKRRGERYGLATLCVGGGMGVAVVVELQGL